MWGERHPAGWEAAGQKTRRRNRRRRPVGCPKISSDRSRPTCSCVARFAGIRVTLTIMVHNLVMKRVMIRVRIKVMLRCWIGALYT